jgi:glycosyltransferase involved in cell wall biosynthesis
MTVRVCFLIPSFDDGGAQRQCIYLLNELQQRNDIELHLIHFREGRHYSLLRRERLKIVRIDTGSFYDPRNILKLIQITQQIKPDVLFSWLHSCDVYAFFAKKRNRQVKWLLAERDSQYPPDPRYEIRRRVGLHADGIVCNSEAGVSYWLRNGAQAEIVNNIPNIAVRPGGNPIPTLRGRRTALYAGRLEPQKNVVTVARAFCLLGELRPENTFLVVGDGSERDLIASVIARSNQPNVHLLPFSSTIGDYFATTDVFVNMSLHEGMPNTVIENVLHGNRIVASDIPEHRVLLGPEYPYYVQTLQQPDGAAKIIDAAMAAAPSLGELAFARRRVEAMSPSVITDAYHELFRELTGR